MLQQTTVEKTKKRFGLLDRIFADTDKKREQRADVDFLSDDYAAAIKIAVNLSSHSRWIPYPFLLNRIKRIADEVRNQAEILRVGIVELGGQVPQVSVESREPLEFHQNVKRLVKDMEEHASRSEILVHQKNKIQDDSVVKLIDTIILDMQRQKEELLDIVMRLA